MFASSVKINSQIYSQKSNKSILYSQKQQNNSISIPCQSSNHDVNLCSDFEQLNLREFTGLIEPSAGNRTDRHKTKLLAQIFENKLTNKLKQSKQDTNRSV